MNRAGRKPLSLRPLFGRRCDAVGLQGFIAKTRLKRAEREAKRLHGLQKRVRNQLDELAEKKRKGALSEDAYLGRKDKLEAHRHELVEKLKHVEDQVRHLRAEFHAVEKASA